MDSDKKLHSPVLVKETIGYLRLKKSMRILDCTVGVGGHAEEILNRIGESGYLIGLDSDKETLREARLRLEAASGRFQLFHSNYANIDSILEEAGLRRIDGALFDLGVSSFQIENPERGFSLKSDGPLDMRMDKDGGTTASGIINGCTKSELADLFKKYGDEHFAFRIADSIIKERKRKRIERTVRLAKIVKEALPYRYRSRRIHPATKVFMALRIAVNREMKNLETGLAKIVPFLNKGARICVISFHSIEDRLVKNRFRELARSGELKIITKKPVRPDEAEIRSNPRSRSAKLRVGEKI